MTCCSCKVTKDMHYHRIFAEQAALLFKAGLDRESSIGKDEFTRQLHELGGLVIKINDTTEKQIPFLIVVPNTVMPISRQMELLKFADCTGRSHINDAGFRNLYLGAQQSKLYLAFQVTACTDFVGTAFDFSRWILERGEYGLTAEEGIALARNHPGVLLRAPIDLVGSKYGQGNHIPFLSHVSANGSCLVSKPEDAQDVDPHVFPSCVGRLTF